MFVSSSFSHFSSTLIQGTTTSTPLPSDSKPPTAASLPSSNPTSAISSARQPHTLNESIINTLAPQQQRNPTIHDGATTNRDGATTDRDGATTDYDGATTDRDGATTDDTTTRCHMADLSEEGMASTEDSTLRSKRSSKRKGSGATKATDARRNSSFLRSAARKMFGRKRRSDTDESASEIEGRHVKKWDKR